MLQLKPSQRTKLKRARPSLGVLGLLIVLNNSTANAQCGVLPGPNGEVTTWLVTSPVPTPRASRTVTIDAQLSRALPRIDLQNLTPTANTQWTAVSASNARLRLPGARGPRTAFYGLTMLATEQTTVYLFTGADDGLVVYLDGRELGRRSAVREAREDDTVNELTLAPGSHRLVLRQYVNGGEQSIYARFVGRDFLPTNSVRLSLAGVSDIQCDALALGSAQVQSSLSVGPDGTHIEASLRYPGGTAVRSTETARRLRFVGVSSASASAELPVNGRFVGAITVSHIVATSASSVGLEGPGVARTVDTRVLSDVREALLKAARDIDALQESALPAWLPLGSYWSAKYVQQRLSQLVREGDSDMVHLREEAALLSQLCDEIHASRDPYLNRRGALRRAYRSVVDGTLQPYSLYVPPSFRRGTSMPLVVALHGLHGSSHRMLPILFGRYDKDEDRTHADRHFEALPESNSLLLAPWGFGDAFYRGVGETDVVQAIEAVRTAYGVDADRTYMTGLSMGGIGAASIPLHYPSLFAAAAPLCGYHDYFVRSDTRPPRRAWEEFAMQARSNRNWAENGVNLPMYVVQGTLDRPMTNSTTFVDRYRELHQEIESEYPVLGHDVWSTTYANGNIFTRFFHYRRPAAPVHVHFRTVSTRWRSSFWVAVDRITRSGTWAEIDATIARNSLRINAHNLSALTLTPPASALRVPYEIQLDGDQRTSIRVDRAGPVSVERVTSSSPWTLSTSARMSAPLGPIRDEFDRHLLVVYGARDPLQTALNRRVAEHWAKIRAGVRAQVRVITDEEYQPSMARATTVIVVGTAASNRVLERVTPGLPIHVAGSEISAQSQRFLGATGATFVARSPDAPDGSLVIVTGTTALGVWRSLSLPDLLPDYIVYNDSIAPARGRVILGRYASVLCAGYYDANAQVEANCHDSQSPMSQSPDAADPVGSSEE